jgi:hypothetical protein
MNHWFVLLVDECLHSLKDPWPGLIVLHLCTGGSTRLHSDWCRRRTQQFCNLALALELVREGSAVKAQLDSLAYRV